MSRTLTSRVLLIAAVVISSLQAQSASVLGRAIRSDGSIPQTPCRASLQAETDRRGAPDPDLTDSKTTLSVPLNQLGEFRFTRVPPAKYVLAVECQAASGIRELRVEGNGETRIRPPLRLEDLTLDVHVTPEVDPEGRPWQITVDATMPRLRRIAHNVETGADGRWVRRGLVAGNYRINISTSDGKPWLQRFFNLSAQSGALSLWLPFMRVLGDLRLSARPVPARLIFHNEAGGEPVTLTSDETGYFQGLVPITPGVQETEWTVEVRSTNPPISRRLLGVRLRTAGETSAWLDLALPLFAVHGSVVANDGKPQSGVQVTVEDMTTGAQTSTATDDVGGFELQDLPPSKYTAVADSVEGVSDRTAFQVIEGTESELKLVLNPSERVPVYVVSSQGPVADGAVQVWIPPGVPRWLARTGPDGRVDLKLPPGTAEVGLTVAAQGYAVKLTRLQISHNSDESSNANTVTLDTSGGTLVVNLQSTGHVTDNATTPYLVHKGAIEAIGTLVDLDSNKAYVSGSRSATVQTIEPGVYSLCLIPDPAELTALWFGVPPSNRCRTGSVEQGETLTLASQ